MSSDPSWPPAKRRVPGWPRRWVVLFRLHDYLLFDAPVLFRFWLRSRAEFWQYVMKVEESRRAREADLSRAGGKREPTAAVPKGGAWRID